MGKVQFKLMSNNGYQMADISDSLVDIWKYIRKTINEPRLYFVEQLDDKGNFVDSVSAFYLIENFKDEDTLPLLISDINAS